MRHTPVRWLAVALVLGLAASAAAEQLGPGDRSPAFSLLGSDGQTHSLDQFVGKRGVVIAWFPKAFTGG